MATPAATQAPDGLDLGGQAELKAVLSKGFVLRASRSEHCMLSIQLAADKATAKKLKLSRSVGTLKAALTPGTSTLKVKLSSKAAKAFKKLKRVKLTLTVVVTDAAGNTTTKTLVVTLKK